MDNTSKSTIYDLDKNDLEAINEIFKKLYSCPNNLSRYKPTQIENNLLNGIDTTKNTWRIHFDDGHENEFYIQAEKTEHGYETSVYQWSDDKYPELVQTNIQDIT